MSNCTSWSGQDEANFTDNIKRYALRESAELYLQSSLAYYKDRRYTGEQLIEIEKCMRDILNRTYFEEETLVSVSGLESGRVKNDPKNYTPTDWEKLDILCKPYPFLSIRLRGSDVVRVLRMVETRNKPLLESEEPGKGKIKWDIVFQERSKD